MGLMSFFEYEFLQNALIQSILIAIGCGIVGPLVLANKMTSLVGAVAHAAYGGLGIALFFSLPIMPSSLVFSVICALIIAKLSRQFEHKADAIISVVWAFGMSFGLLLSDLSPGSNASVMSYLFGAILAVNSSDLWMMSIADLLFLIFAVVFYRQLSSVCIDRVFASICGIKEGLIFYALIICASVAIIIGIRAVGLILIIALLSIPSYIASMFCLRLSSSMICSSILAFVFCVCGLIISVMFDLSASACIILLACAVFFVAVLIAKLRAKFLAAKAL